MDSKNIKNNENTVMGAPVRTGMGRYLFDDFEQRLKNREPIIIIDPKGEFDMRRN